MKLSFTQYIPIHVLLFFTLLSYTSISNVSAATIGDWIWADANDNGLLEGGEGGIGDIGVDLLDNEGNLIASTTSNHDGYYIFKDLPAGTYTVAIHQGMLIAPLTTPSTYTVTVAESEAFLTADFGLFTTFSTSNKPPVIITKNACTAPQTPVTVCLEVFEPEGDNTNITAGITQTGATFTILNEDCFRYTPIPGYEGIDTILVTVCDDANPVLCTEGKIAINVPCPGGPLAVDDEVTTTQSTPIIIEVLANDNGQAPLEVTNVDNPSNGTVMLVNNIIIYTPEAGFTGQDSFTYAIKDGSNQTSSATVYITVEEMTIACELEVMQCVEINTSPIICPEYCEVEGSSLNILEITSQIGSELVESPSEEGCYKYVPPMDFTGTDVITILACNAEGNCAQTTINIEVTADCDGGGNNQIIANDDFVVAIQNTFVLIGVLTNDVDPQGDEFSIQGFEQPSNGTVTQTDDGLLNYVPNTAFVGTDMFTYRICDVNGNCDEATVTINVIDNGITDCTQNAEVCDNATTATEICVEFCNVGDAVITEASSVLDGTININNATCFNYLPPAEFTGIDEIDVVGCNTSGECDTILVTVTIACPAPDASDDIGGTMVGQVLNLNVLENDAQICDYILSATLIGGAQMGEAVLDSNGNLSYTPSETAAGQEILEYIACNDCANALCDTANIIITVGDNFNQPPIAVDDQGLTLLNTSIDIFILLNDSDPDGDNLSATILGVPSNGTASINPDTQIATYVPNTGFEGTDFFTYLLCDTGNPVLCDTATVNITVGEVSVNNPPTAGNDAIVTQINETIGVGVLANDSDPDGDNIIVTGIATPPSNGTAEFNPSSVIYTPNENFIGADSIEYILCDDGVPSLCDTALIVVTVINPGGNLPPTALDDNINTTTNTPINIDVLANDNDPEGANLTISDISIEPSNGTVVLNNGVLVYTPNTNFIGTDSFEYVVCDPQGACDTALVVVEVSQTLPNQSPVAVDDASNTIVNTPITIPVLANDSDPDGDELTLTGISTEPSNGTAVIEGGTVIYTPNPEFEGEDSFEYVVCDSEGACDTALVVVTISEAGSNNPPVAGDDGIVTQLNTPIGVGVLGNDSDPDGDDLIVTAITTSPSNGTAEFNPSSVIYTPNENFIGMDTLEYVVCDNGIPVLCDTATIIITVINPGGNLPPIAVDDNVTTEVNTQIGIDVLENDSDPEGGNLTITLISTEPSNGTVFLGNGLLNYTPNIDFIGVDSFEYVICDPQGLCDTALVVVTVEQAGANQAPIAVDDSATTEENIPIEILVLENDSDPDGDGLIVTINEAPSNGTVVVADGIPTYTPNTDFIGVDSFEYVICDPDGLCDTASVIVTVSEEVSGNQAPIAVDDSATTEENISIEIPVLDNDSDPDGDELTVTINEAPSNGTVVVGGGIPTYTPNEDFIGVDSFEYVICDPDGLCDTALVVVDVLVEGTNQAPIAVDDAETIDANVPLAIDVLANDSDPNGDEISLILIPTLPENGIAEFNIDSSAVVYTPNEDFIGVDSFEYVICDNGNPVLCDTALVVITVEQLEENEAPVAVDDLATAFPNTSIDIPVLENDSDPDGDELTIVDINEAPSNGSAEINDEGTGIDYTPNEGFEGQDTLEYVICDPDGFCDTAMVIIDVFEPLFPIIADTTEEDTPLTICVDEFFDTINVSIDSMTIFIVPQNGTVLVNDDTLPSDSCLIYTPAEDFNGGDTFLLGICNVIENTCDTITVNITVLPTNDPPIATDDLANTEVNAPIEIPVLENDSDIDGDELTVVAIEESPSNGEAIINPDGTITYTPDIDFSGVDTFVYVISDPDGLTDTATVLIGIGQGLGIIAVDDVDSTEMETSVEIPVLENDLFDGVATDSTIITILSNTSNGVLVVNGNEVRDSTVTYTPLPEFAGTDTFEYVVCVADLCDTATVVIVVTEVVDECELFIPNAFSPNNDGANDRFLIPNLAGCFPDNELVIFNRWGDEIFRQENYDENNLWDGTWQKNGDEVPDGTYFYILTGSGEEGEQLEPRSGFIELCR